MGYHWIVRIVKEVVVGQGFDDLAKFVSGCKKEAPCKILITNAGEYAVETITRFVFEGENDSESTLLQQSRYLLAVVEGVRLTSTASLKVDADYVRISDEELSDLCGICGYKTKRIVQEQVNVKG